MKPRLHITALLLIAIPVSSLAQDWTPLQSMKVKRIGRVDVSPDGKRVVYAVREALLDKGRSEYLSHIYLANEDGSSTIQLTSGDKSCDDPQWSPDGKWIAFGSKKSGKRNLWLITPSGKDPVQLAEVKTGVTSFKWSPDSKQIAFTATDGLTEKEEKATREKNDARVVDENFKFSRLYVVAVDGKNKQEGQLLTKESYHVPTTGRAGYDWSPDGKSIVFTRTKTPRADDWTTADVAIVDVEQRTTRSFLPPTANIADALVRYAPHFSPDGMSIVFVASPRTWAGEGIVLVYTLGRKNITPLARTADEFGRYSELLGWHPDGDRVFFTEMNGTQTRVGTLSLDGKMATMQGLGVGTGLHLNAARTCFGFSWETLKDAPEAHFTRTGDFKPLRVSKVNAKLPRATFGATEVIRWKSKDGLEVEGLLTYPAKYKPGQRYPLLVYIHGGPMGVFTQTYVGAPGLYPIASFSERGYAVLRPNPRGSSGYGAKFRYANYKDWGGGDYQDIMAGVDHVIGMGVADKDRLGVMGWSYGGFMTSWIVTQTKRFKAASCGAGVTNLVSFTGTADIPGFLPDYFDGEFWDKPGLYEKHSAMFHVKGVTTPTLIQHGERDERVPLSQGLEFYNALKRQKCETKMVIYPRTPHGIEEPRLLVDCMERNLAWFDRYVK